MNKAALLAELATDTYVMIRPSPVEGIGVFAIRHIPKGCRTIFSSNNIYQEAYIKISHREVAALPAHSKTLIETYCLYDEENYYVPENGFKKMDLVNFLNHSEEPNIISINEGEFFETIRDINEGEELFVNYGDLVEESSS